MTSALVRAGGSGCLLAATEVAEWLLGLLHEAAGVGGRAGLSGCRGASGMTRRRLVLHAECEVGGEGQGAEGVCILRSSCWCCMTP